jgi:hypothetical protein
VKPRMDTLFDVLFVAHAARSADAKPQPLI